MVKMVVKLNKGPKKCPNDAANEGSFWGKICRPFFVLAPMANVTDFAFRSMIAKYGKPDVMWTEFVSADGLNSRGRKKLLIDLKFSRKERPIVAQLFTGHPEAMRKAAALCAELGFDGLDINMGCPDRAVEKQGGGAAMMKDFKAAIEVLQAAREGWRKGKKEEGMMENKQIRMGQIGLKIGKKSGDSAEDVMMEVGGGFSVKNANATKLRLQLSGKIGESTSETQISAPALVPVSVSEPISIKTRIGYNKVDFGWLRLLLEQKLPALTVHLRTRKEMSDVPAHWELMPDIIKLRDEVQADLEPNERTLIIGNGDVESVADGVAKLEKYGGDGVMIGRGIFGKPWLFESLCVTPAKATRELCERSRSRMTAGVQWETTNSKRMDSGRSLPLAPNRGRNDTLVTKTPEERLKIMVEHAKLYEKTFCGPGPKRIKNFAVMKKHFKAYVSGWDGAKELRVKLMETENAGQVKKIVDEYLKGL